MILYRLTQIWAHLREGSCISEARYKKLYYVVRPLYEVITDDDEMFEYKDEKYCRENDVEKILFHSKEELNNFKNDINNRNIN